MRSNPHRNSHGCHLKHAEDRKVVAKLHHIAKILTCQIETEQIFIARHICVLPQRASNGALTHKYWITNKLLNNNNLQ